MFYLQFFFKYRKMFMKQIFSKYFSWIRIHIEKNSWIRIKKMNADQQPCRGECGCKGAGLTRRTKLTMARSVEEAVAGRGSRAAGWRRHPKDPRKRQRLSVRPHIFNQKILNLKEDSLVSRIAELLGIISVGFQIRKPNSAPVLGFSCLKSCISAGNSKKKTQKFKLV